MSGRPRRTRLYDTSYNIGQSYYQPTLDRLDRKFTGRPEVPDRPVSKFNVDNMFDDDLKLARRRAEKAIVEDGFLDVKDIKFPRPVIVDEFDEEVSARPQVQSSLNRIKASRQMLSKIDDEFEDTLTSMKRRNRNLSEKLKESNDDDDFSFRSRVRVVSDMEPAKVGSKWCKTTDVSEVTTGAVLRAKASQARLQDLEADMFDRTERQMARDKRLANMKKVLAENDIDSNAMQALSLTKVEKHVSF